MKLKHLLKLFGYAILVLVLIGLVSNTNFVYDFFRLHNYTPPAAIKQLADDTVMTDKLRRIYYVNHPVLENKTAFNSHCREDELTIVLGCYVKRQGIYIYDVNDSRLAGIDQVTAAHEALHAAYDRLSPSERRRIDKLTKTAYEDLKDQRIKDRVALYASKGQTVVSDELHSILGTESPSLPSELESYYKQYFTDRSKVVGFASSYSAAFEDRKRQIDDYDKQLGKWKLEIDQLKNSLEAQANVLEQKQNSMNTNRSAGNISAYNAAVPSYNRLVDSYNSEVARLKSLVDSYNETVIKRNAFAIEENDLAKAIDSRETVPEAK